MSKVHILVSVIVLLALSACQETLEQRGAREAREYTEKHCPTAVDPSITLDSMTFQPGSHTFSYCYTLSGPLDDSAAVWRGDPRGRLLMQVRNSTHLKLYKDAGYAFRYVYYSTRRPGMRIFDETFTADDYR